MNSNIGRCGLAAVAAGALAAGLVAGPAASAGPQAGAAKPATVVMKFNGKRFFFAGAKQVSAGDQLKIVNATKPRKVGPHTFSLADNSVRPNTKQERKQCFTPKHICLDIALAHKFNPKTEKVNKQLVKAGAPGWNVEFTKGSKTGDSWYTEKFGESFTQTVSAEPGTTLRFMCAVHVGMQGKIKVVE